ncbi:MAG: RNA polymerase sigma-70 factor [Odoribacter splanchnicus]
MNGEGVEILYAELVGELRRRSHAAFEKVFREMGPKLYRFALTYLMNADMAEDVVQDTFMRFWTALDSLPEDTRVSTYLYASVKNSCLNYYKHLRVEDSNRTKLTEALIFMGSLQYEDCEELFEKVQECLQQLPEQQRRVIELKLFKDMSYKEIAGELNLSEVTVHTHVKRAYKAIRESLPVFYLFLSVLGKI